MRGPKRTCRGHGVQKTAYRGRLAAAVGKPSLAYRRTALKCGLRPSTSRRRPRAAFQLGEPELRWHFGLSGVSKRSGGTHDYAPVERVLIPPPEMATNYEGEG